MRTAADGTRTLLHIFPGFDIGGAQARFTAVANHFGQAYRHVIVSMDGATGARARLDPGLDVEFRAVSVKQGRTLGNLRPFHRFLSELRPHALITHNWGSIDWVLANLAARLRHIHIEDGFGPEERDRQLPRRILLRRLALRRSTVVLPSRNLERIAAEVWRLPRRRLRYIPNGVDLARFEGPPSPDIPPGAGLVIGTVAALRPEKALDRLLRAFAPLPDQPLLVIVGDGTERAGLECLAHDLGIAERVLFTGHVNNPSPLYRAFDVFALSSVTEQMPLSVIEAMASGLPVAATDVGDVRLMLATENHIFVGQKNDEASLSTSLRALCDSAALRDQLGAANRAKAARDYDQRTMFAAYGALFDASETGPSRHARNE